MYEVNLPSLKWFMFGNVYTGSLGTDPARGCLNTTTFNYRVYVMGGALWAACWFELPWNAVYNMDEMIIGLFEASDFGIEVAGNWIRSKFVTSDAAAPALPQTAKGLPAGQKSIAEKNVSLLCDAS
jgi:hypothetical protein